MATTSTTVSETRTHPPPAPHEWQQQQQQTPQQQQQQQQQRPERVRIQAQPPTPLMPDGVRAYTPLKMIGDGSFGTVWLCDWHSPLPPGTPLSPMQCGQGAKLRPEWNGKRLVAVKRLNRRWAGGWEECSRLKELESLRRISSHPSIIPLYDAFLLPSSLELYFVFESMEGNLYQLIKARKTRPFAAGLIASIFKQIIAGLAHMHDQGYFHRDMKPENLLVTTTGVAEYGAVPGRNGVYRNGTSASQGEKDVQVIVKLADFGLAREIMSEPPYTEYVSTRWYRAPEVLLRARDYSAPVDLWAFGTIIAELVNLRPLFPGSGELDQLGKIRDVLGDWSRDYGYDERGVPLGGGAWPRGMDMISNLGYQIDAKTPVDFNTLFEPYVSPILVECIADLLKYDPARRLTAQQVANHRYLAETEHVLPAHIVPGAMPAAPPLHTLNHSASQSSLERVAHSHAQQHRQHSAHQHHLHLNGLPGPSQISLPLTHSQTQLMQISPVSPRSLPPSHAHSPAYPKPAFPAGDLPTPPPNGPNQRLPPFYPLTPSPSSSHMSPGSARSPTYFGDSSAGTSAQSTLNSLGGTTAASDLVNRVGEMDIDISYGGGSGAQGADLQAQHAELRRQQLEAEAALLRSQEEQRLALKRQFEERERALLMQHQQQQAKLQQQQAQQAVAQAAQQHAQQQAQQQQQQATKGGMLGSLGFKKAKGWGLFGHSDKQAHSHSLSQEDGQAGPSNQSLKRPQSGSGSNPETRSLQEASPVGAHPPIGPYGHVFPPVPAPVHQNSLPPQLVVPPPLPHQTSHGSNGSSSTTQSTSMSKKDERKAKEDARKLEFEKKQRLQRERARAQLAKRNQIAAPQETGWSEWDAGKTQMNVLSNPSPSIHAVLNGADSKGKHRAHGPSASVRSLGRAAASVRTYSSLQEEEARHAELEGFEARTKARRRDGDGDHSMSSSDLLSIRSSQTQHSDYSDPGPSHARFNQYLRGTISTSSLRTNSSLPPTNHAPTQTYGQTTPLESQFINDFSTRAKVGSPDLNSSSSTFGAPPSSFKMGLPPISSLPLNGNGQVQVPMYGLPTPAESAGNMQNGNGNGNGNGLHPMFRLPSQHLSPLSSDMDQDGPDLSQQQQQQTVLPPFSELVSFSSHGNNGPHQPPG